MTKKKPMTDLEIREVALEAQADPRTVKKIHEGGEVRGVVADRIRRAMERRVGGVVRGDVTGGVRRGE